MPSKRVPKVTLLFFSPLTEGETMSSCSSFAPSHSAPWADEVTVSRSLHCSLPADSLSGCVPPFWSLSRSCQP